MTDMRTPSGAPEGAMAADLPTHALTLWRPWCWAICHAGKDIENRTWRPPSWMAYGGLVAIHSGQRWDGAAEQWLRDEHYARVGVEPMLVPPTRQEWPGGRIVAIARCTGFVTAGTFGGELNSAEAYVALHSFWFDGPFGWVLRDARVLAKPVPCNGAQGLWSIPEDVRARLLGKAGA